MMLDREEMHDSEPRRSGSSNRASSSSSSLRRRSLNSVYALSDQVDDDAECESVSEAGDIGDRSLRSSRNSASSRLHFSFDNTVESGAVVPVAEDTSLQPSRSCSHSTMILNAKTAKNEEAIPWMLEYISCLIFLALFGYLGVIARFYLQKLFGPGAVGATSDQNYMYLDLPSNMVGSFLMGWFGVVFKGGISRVSDNLAIGLTTGFLGSLTTFSGWNQKLLELSVEGRWVFSVLSIVLGIFLVAYSIEFGIETANGFKWLMKKWGTKLKFFCHEFSWNYHKYLAATLVLLFIFTVVWGACIIVEIKEFKSATNNTRLLLACIVGPFGVWIRWFLARFNGRGLGKRARLKWVPFGTLVANVLAASIMAALAILKKVVKKDACDTVATGIQLGFCGCLSTVSTFVAEFNAMRQSSHPWRAYAYAMTTIIISFALGTLIYSLPIWTKGYN